MKAVQINSYGGNEVLTINENTPKPAPKEHQVLVEVFAASINPIDYKIRAGYLKDAVPLKFPVTLGGDFAGKVIEVSEDVSEFVVEDEVFGSAIILSGGSGAFSEFATANISNISYKPKSANFEESSALPLVGSSAVQALEEHIKLQSGQKILIHGGAGGIGHIAVQLAKAAGAYVVTTASTEDVEFVKQLGADKVIDYKQQVFEEILKEYDAVFDTVGAEVVEKSFGVLKKGGILVSMLGQPDEELAKKYGVIAVGQNTQTNTAHLTRIAELVDEEKIKIHIAKVFPLDDVKEAAALLESHPQGKVVLAIKE